MSARQDSDDDSLLHAIGARARARRQEVEALEALATPGSLRGDNAQAANAQTANASEGLPSLADSPFDPLDASARDRLVDAIASRVSESAGNTAPEPVATQAKPTDRKRAAFHRGQPARHLEHRSRTDSAAASRFKRIGIGAISVGLVAAAALFFLSQQSPPRPALAVVYALEVQAGDQTTRSGEPDPDQNKAFARLDLESSMELRARPTTPTNAEAIASYVRRARDSHFAPLSVPPEISADGVIRWRGTARQLFGEKTGDLDILLIIGRRPLPNPATLPTTSAADGVVTGSRSDSWQSLRTRIHVNPAPGP